MGADRWWWIWGDLAVDICVAFLACAFTNSFRHGINDGTLLYQTGGLLEAWLYQNGAVQGGSSVIWWDRGNGL